MEMNKKVVIGIAIVVLALGGYWEYSRIACASIAKEYGNRFRAGRTISDLQRMYDLKYTICMGERGL